MGILGVGGSNGDGGVDNDDDDDNGDTALNQEPISCLNISHDTRK